MITLDDFKKFDFRHITTQEFFEIEALLAQLIIERNSYREFAQAKVAKIERMKGPRPFSAYDDNAFYNEVDLGAKHIWDHK